MSNKKYIPKVDYSRLTVNDPNPIKRSLQNLRLSHSLKTLNNLGHNFSGNILDFGAGNAELMKRLAGHYKSATLVAYEPAMDLYLQAKDNIVGLNNVEVIKQLNDLKNQKFDFIFCMEVFEHLPDEKITESLNIINHLLMTTGKVIIGVPNEIYLAALVKGVFRMLRRYGDIDATFKNILKSTFGHVITERKMEYIDENLPYITRHIGFDYRRFKSQVNEHLIIDQKYGSPFIAFPFLFNFEIYFSCTKRNKKK